MPQPYSLVDAQGRQETVRALGAPSRFLEITKRSRLARYHGGGLLTFEEWKELLRKDCIACDKLAAFDGLGEIILRILHMTGTEPTVEAVVRDGLNGRLKG